MPAVMTAMAGAVGILAFRRIRGLIIDVKSLRLGLNTEQTPGGARAGKEHGDSETRGQGRRTADLERDQAKTERDMALAKRVMNRVFANRVATGTCRTSFKRLNCDYSCPRPNAFLSMERT